MPEPIVIKMASTDDFFIKKKQHVPNITQGGMMDIKLKRLESIEFILPVFLISRIVKSKRHAELVSASYVLKRS